MKYLGVKGCQRQFLHVTVCNNIFRAVHFEQSTDALESDMIYATLLEILAAQIMSSGLLHTRSGHPNEAKATKCMPTNGNNNADTDL